MIPVEDFYNLIVSIGKNEFKIERGFYDAKRIMDTSNDFTIKKIGFETFEVICDDGWSEYLLFLIGFERAPIFSKIIINNTMIIFAVKKLRNDYTPPSLDNTGYAVYIRKDVRVSFHGDKIFSINEDVLLLRRNFGHGVVLVSSLFEKGEISFSCLDFENPTMENNRIIFQGKDAYDNFRQIEYELPN